MNKKKLILTIGLSALAVCAIVICFILIAKPFTPKGDGEITVEYVALDGTVIKEKEIVFNEQVETRGMGLTPSAAGALTQLRAFATVYQEIVEKIEGGVAFPEVLDSVLQPHVEFYKKNLKGGVVVPGRISK